MKTHNDLENFVYTTASILLIMVVVTGVLYFSCKIGVPNILDYILYGLF